MIVYGKAARRVAVAAILDEVRGWLAEAASASLPIERHAAWTSALLAAGELAQGLADAGWRDGEAAALFLATELAAVMGRSWETGFTVLPAAVTPAVAEAVAALAAAALPEAVDVRRTEGFAHYAVYPEAFWAAAAALGPPRPTRVLGIRSIGTTLGACAAAALGLGAPHTVRPQGHPFARAIVPARDVAAAMRDGADEVWAVVDEGPGLSGSSMGAAADALVGAGVAPGRLVLLPSHGGAPGAMASAAHRRLWSTARSAVLAFEDLWGGAGPPGRGLGAWVADVTGPLLAPPEDVAGGGWRRHHYGDKAEWPAVDRQNERRKHLLHGRHGGFLLRFTGLGSFGRAKYERARRLAEAGFGVEPLAWRHGFLIERWRGDLRPLTLAGTDRPTLLGRLADYLAFRARTFPARGGEGASPAVLLAMARVNTAEALGDAAADGLDRWAPQVEALESLSRPVAIDGRLGPQEWLGDGSGLPLKVDALDHCCAHDLVGCQDVAWDVAGAAIEWDLDDGETEALRLAVARRSGHPCDAGLVAFMRVAYAAFRVGASTMARDRAVGDEVGRCSASLSRQLAALRGSLDRPFRAVRTTP